jgi:hypothetical protein
MSESTFAEGPVASIRSSNRVYLSREKYTDRVLEDKYAEEEYAAKCLMSGGSIHLLVQEMN